MHQKQTRHNQVLDSSAEMLSRVVWSEISTPQNKRTFEELYQSTDEVADVFGVPSSTFDTEYWWCQSYEGMVFCLLCRFKWVHLIQNARSYFFRWLWIPTLTGTRTLYPPPRVKSPKPRWMTGQHSGRLHHHHEQMVEKLHPPMLKKHKTLPSAKQRQKITQEPRYRSLLLVSKQTEQTVNNRHQSQSPIPRKSLPFLIKTPQLRTAVLLTLSFLTTKRKMVNDFVGLTRSKHKFDTRKVIMQQCSILICIFLMNINQIKGIYSITCLSKDLLFKCFAVDICKCIWLVNEN